MMAAVIKLVLSNPTMTLLVAGFLAALVSLGVKKRPWSRETVVETLVAYFFLFSIGISYLYNFVMHVFFAGFTAAYIGWADSPFQYEVGFASLGIGVAGVLSFRHNLAFRVATFLPPAFFLWGAAGGHIYQIVTAHNMAPGNAGTILWTDILLPVIGFVLLWAQWKNPTKSG